MKLRSRLLTFILSASMALSMTSPVLADERVAGSTTTATQEAENNKVPAEQDNHREEESQPVQAQAEKTTEEQSVSAEVVNTVQKQFENAQTMENSVAGTPSSTAEVPASSAGSSDTAAADSAATGTDAQAEEKNTETAERTEDSGQNTGRISETAVAIKDSRNKIAKNIEGKDALLLVAGDAEQDQLTAEITPADAADHTVTWKSEDESVVKVDADGKLTAGREGTAKITVTTTDGGRSASLLVTVQAAKENSSAADGGKQGSASGKAEETQKTADDAGNDTEDSDNVQKQDDSASVISGFSTEGAEALLKEEPKVLALRSFMMAASEKATSDGESSYVRASYNNSTALADGTYQPADQKMPTNRKGKQILSCDKILVNSGKAYVILTATSGFTTYYDGTASGKADAETENTSAGFYKFSGGQVTVPVALNSEMTFSAYNPSMGKWFSYSFTVNLENTAQPEFDNITTLADGDYPGNDEPISTSANGIKVYCDQIVVKDGTAKAHIYFTSKNYSHVYIGAAAGYEQNTKNPEKVDEKLAALLNDKVRTIPTSQEVINGSTVSAAWIPVKLNTPMTFSGRNTGMTGKVIWKTFPDITFRAEEKTMNLSVSVQDENGNSIPADVTVAEGSQKLSAQEGKYSLTVGAAYTISASADGYESSSVSYTAADTTEDKVILTLKKKTQENGFRTGALIIKKTPAMFKIVSASLEGTENNRKLRIALNGTSYTQLFRGSQADAAKSDSAARIGYSVNQSGKYEFVIPVTEKDGIFSLAALSKNRNAWYARTITLDQSNMTISCEAMDWQSDPYKPVPDGAGKQQGGSSVQGGGQGSSGNGKKTISDSKADKTESTKGATSGGNAVGKYRFSYSGGSGRAVISCSKVEIVNGQAYATITFSRANGGTSSYTAVRVGGRTYNGSNTFTIPVNLNGNTAISALTSAMSAEHWIDYTLYIGESGGGETGTSVKDSTKALDEKAPEITGIKSIGETEITYSDKLKIFNYENDIHLIEVNLIADTARTDTSDEAEQTDESTSESGKTKSTDSPEKSVDAETDNVEESVSSTSSAASPEEKEEKLYTNPIVKYLVVPESQEIPAGLEKDVIIIRQPADKTFVTSPEALKILSELGKTEDIKALGVEDNDIEDGSVRSALEKEDGEDGKIYQAGTYDKWDLKTLIKQETNFAIESSKILPKEEKNADEDMKSFEKLASQAVQMDMAMFVDRSADEKNDLAKAEWYKVYGIIFDAQDQAEELYKKAVDKASEQEKKEAVEALKAEKSTEK